VKGSDIPIPFYGLGAWAQGKITPLLRTQYDLYRNRDAGTGRAILKGSYPERVIRGLVYELEGIMPVGLGAIVGGLRNQIGDKTRGIQPGVIAEEVVAQELGANLMRERPETKQAATTARRRPTFQSTAPSKQAATTARRRPTFQSTAPSRQPSQPAPSTRRRPVFSGAQ